MKNYAIILASGTGNRFGGKLPKQFVKIGEKTILEHTIEKFENIKEIDSIVLVITPDYQDIAEDLVLKNNYKKISKIVKGGETRKDSSYNGVISIEEEEANVLIHDCARPFVSKRIILDCIEALKSHKAAAVAVPSTDTLIEVKNDVITNIPERASLMRIQTPQCFKLSVIKKAHELSLNDKNFTDDCGLVIKHNLCEIFLVAGERENIKITFPEDIVYAKNIIRT